MSQCDDDRGASTKRTLQRCLATASVLSFIACGSGASVPGSTASGTYFKQATLRSAPVSVSGATSAAYRRLFGSVSACTPGTLALGAQDDVWMWVQGTASDGASINFSAENFSSGYANFITSPIAGGYNIAEVQANIPGQFATDGTPWNLMKSLVVTTNGSTSVSVSVPVVSNTATANLVIVDNGKTMQSIPLNSYFTLSHGEIIGWTGKLLTENVTDPAGGGNITATVAYTPNNQADMNFLDLEVVGSNVTMGGYLVNAAMNAPKAGGAPTIVCTPPPTTATIPPGNPPTTPAPTSSPLCALPIGTTPNPHPTQNASSTSCTS